MEIQEVKKEGKKTHKRDGSNLSQKFQEKLLRISNLNKKKSSAEYDNRKVSNFNLHKSIDFSGSKNKENENKSEHLVILFDKLESDDINQTNKVISQNEINGDIIQSSKSTILFNNREITLDKEENKFCTEETFKKLLSKDDTKSSPARSSKKLYINSKFQEKLNKINSGKVMTRVSFKLEPSSTSVETATKEEVTQLQNDINKSELNKPEANENNKDLKEKDIKEIRKIRKNLPKTLKKLTIILTIWSQRKIIL